MSLLVLILAIEKADLILIVRFI